MGTPRHRPCGRDRVRIDQEASPSLTQVEWTAHRQKVVLSEKSMETVADLVARPPKPTAVLRKVLAKRTR